MSYLDEIVPNLTNGESVSNEGLQRLALEIMKGQDPEPEPEIIEPVIEEPVPAMDIFKHTVDSERVYIKNTDGSLVELTGFHAMNRTRKDGTSTEPEILHVAPRTTAIITMEQIESVAHELIKCGYKLTGSGEMKNNRWLFIELEHADLPTLEFDGTNLVPKMWIGSSHDGSLAMKSTVKLTDTWCENTFMLNSASELLFKAKHTRNADIKIQDYEQGIRSASDLIKEYYSLAEKMNDTSFVGQQRLEKFFAHTLGAEKKSRVRKINGKEYDSDPMYSGKHENQLNQLFESYQYGKGQNERGETVWSAFSAVTDWCDNHEGNQKSRDMGTNVIGSRARQKQRAWDLATQMVQ